MTYQIGYSKEKDIRFQASSGGVGTAIIKYLLESGRFGTSMTFVFNAEECRYEPKLIYDFSDYNNCGSIYQDTDNIGFIKSAIKEIRNGIVVTCMPCQVAAVRSLLDRNNIPSFIISLCCSGQTTVEGTWLYYKLLGIDKKDVCNIQYRGSGWPSGIRIKLKDGTEVYRDNYTYPWTLMHKSQLYRPKRCLYCKEKTNTHSDVTLADPWLKELMENDKTGNSFIISNHEGETVLKEMENKGLLALRDSDEKEFIVSQLGTIEAKIESSKHKALNRMIARMGREGSFYKKVFTCSETMLKSHMFIMRMLRKIL